MPEKPLTIATYAAGASLAAITLVYVFGPTFLLDDEASSSRKKSSVVGLSNAANDCFINSILQALAGLPDLRVYLIRETHRRELDGAAVYELETEKSVPQDGSVKKLWKRDGLQKGEVTYALKEILDKLNERPLHRKTISPLPFIRSLERAFSTRISRQQQDAQEFLQIVTERLCDEYHAGTKARHMALQNDLEAREEHVRAENMMKEQLEVVPPGVPEEGNDKQADGFTTVGEEGFPFEGKIESQIECLTCKFKPRPQVSTFVTLTLNVPQASSTSLNQCLDGVFKEEHIDDFKCDYCRLEHALRAKVQAHARATTTEARAHLQSDIGKLEEALETDPESAPEGVELPHAAQAPKRRIARHMYISSFPKVLALHLSRSVFAAGSISTKNFAKVAFPERLALGSLLNRKNYQLVGMVSHKGTHNSGHYESFRRQVQPVPYSTPHSFGTGGVYSRQGSPMPSAVPSPRLSASHDAVADRGSPIPATPALDSPSLQSLSSSSSVVSRGPAPTSAPRDDDSLRPPSLASTSLARKLSMRSLREKASSVGEKVPLRRKPKRATNRWWRISDDKIKESKTSEVLGLQQEVYLLFYELVKPATD